MAKFLRSAAKKIYKSGFFTDLQLEKHALYYRDCYGNVHSIQQIGNVYRMRIGRPITQVRRMLTFESDYKSLGDVEVSQFIDHIRPEITTNPDYVLRLSLAYLDINSLTN